MVIEVESPGDESREKLPFYLGVGVREVLLIDRDTRRVELLRASETGWIPVAPTSAGWVRSEVLRTELRTEPPVASDRPPAIRIRRSDEISRSLLIP